MSLLTQPQCCCGCQYKEFALLLCNCNDITDDDLTLKLNGNTLVTALNLQVGTGTPPKHYPGAWWATDTTITLAKLNQIIKFDTSPLKDRCEANMGAVRPLNKDWLIDSNNNLLTVQSVADRHNGNFGCLWYVIYHKKGANNWTICYKADNYQPTTLGPIEEHKFPWFKNQAAKKTANWIGPKDTT